MKDTRAVLHWDVLFDALFEEVAYNHGRVLYGLNFDVRTAACRVILKTYTDGRAEICYINASTLERCLEVLNAFLNTNSTTGVEWMKDQYYKPA